MARAAYYAPQDLQVSLGFIYLFQNVAGEAQRQFGVIESHLQGCKVPSELQARLDEVIRPWIERWNLASRMPGVWWNQQAFARQSEMVRIAARLSERAHVVSGKYEPKVSKSGQSYLIVLKRKFLQQVQGCILGTAIGDARGMPYEGRKTGAIPLDPFYQAHPTREWAAGSGTDDTQVTMIILESLNQNHDLVPFDVMRRLGNWYQAGEARGIGDTFKTALRRLSNGARWDEVAVQESEGNGIAMCVAPVALRYAYDMEELGRKIEQLARLTHDNAQAIAGAKAVAYVIALCLRGQFDRDTVIQQVNDFVDNDPLRKRLTTLKALLFHKGMTPEAALKRLGTKGHVLETVPASLYAFLKLGTDPDAMFSALIQAGGDTDTTCAIAGAMTGALYGCNVFPQQWVASVENSETILAESRKLAGLLVDEIIQPL